MITVEQFCEWVDRNEIAGGKQVWRELEADAAFWEEVLAKRAEYVAAVAMNRKLPHSILVKLSENSDWRIRHSVAQQRKCPQDLLQLLAGDPEALVRGAVAGNKSTPREILELLKEDPDWTVSKKVLARLRRLDGATEPVVGHREYRNLKYRAGEKSWDGEIRNEGGWIFVAIRGVEFGGHCFECLKPSKNSDPVKLKEFTLNSEGELCNCTIEVESQLLVEIGGKMEPQWMGVCITLAGADVEMSGVKLELRLGEAVFRTARPSERFKEQLLEIQEQLPMGIFIRSCLTCEKSDYRPDRRHFEGKRILGTLACFRDNLHGLLKVRTDEEYAEVWDSLTGFCRETSDCSEYQRRTSGRGYHG